MELVAIPALENNYIWLLINRQKQVVIIDPGVSQPVIEFITKHQLSPIALLLTHHHWDHINGVYELHLSYPTLSLYAPTEVIIKLPQLAHVFQCVDRMHHIKFANQSWQVITTPGHTLGHVCYYHAPYLFCGDTLFSGGCGRIFEGTAQQLYQSLIALCQLPNDTKICAAHELTLNNLAFATELLPQDEELRQYFIQMQLLRQQQHATLPSTLAIEKRINIFLRCQDAEFCHNFIINGKTIDGLALFSYFRELKNHY